VRIVLIFILLLSGIGPGHAQSIQQIDFKNFVYPWVETRSSERLKWLPIKGSQNVKLVDGREVSSDESEKEPGDERPFSGLILESVSFARLTPAKLETALVVLRYDSGGTQYWYYVYLFTIEAGKPKLLDYFQTGERAYGGLYQAYVKSGNLVVELFDPAKRQGDCCSSRIVRTQYRWSQGRFSQFGPAVFAVPKSMTRLAVSTFGIHSQ
jgi:hypothetical protein